MNECLQKISERKKFAAWSISTLIPLIVLWFIILDEKVFTSLIKNQGFRVPLVIVAVAASISWTYGVLKKLRLYGVLQMKLLPGRLMVSIVFITLLLTAKAIYSWQTQNWGLFVGGVFLEYSTSYFSGSWFTVILREKPNLS